MKGTVVKKGASYYCVYRVSGKQKWVKGGDTKRQAEKKLAEIVNDIGQGTYRELKEIGFQDFAALWIDSYAKTRCKASTLRSYEDIIKGHLIPYFANMSLIVIAPSSIQKYVSQKLAEVKKDKKGNLIPKFAAKTVNNHLVPLKEMLKHAVIWGYLKENPAQYVEKPRVEHEEMDFLTPEEIHLFLAKVTPKYHPLFLTAVLTGLRRGELLALQWGDIEFIHNLIYVRRSLYKGKFVSPKSKKSVRKVVMTTNLASVLKRHKLESQPNDLDLVFANGEGKPNDGDTLVKRQFLPALRRAGLRQIRFHDLRHTYTALLIRQGENVKFIQSQLGHASIQTTLDRYGHLLPESNREAGERLDAILGFKAPLKMVSDEPVRNLLEKEPMQAPPLRLAQQAEKP